MSFASLRRSECPSVLPPASNTAFRASPASTSAPATLGLDLRVWLFVLTLGACLGGLFHPLTLPRLSSSSIDSAISATSFKVSGPGTLHAPCMLRLLSLLSLRLACGSSSAQVQGDRGLETRLSRLPQVLSWHQALSWKPAQAFSGSVESTFVRRSKSPSEVADWSYLAKDMRNTGASCRGPGSLARPPLRMREAKARPIRPAAGVRLLPPLAPSLVVVVE